MRLLNYTIGLFAAAFFSGCTPDKGPGGLGAKPDAKFTVASLSGKINQYVVTASDAKAVFYWDKGDGSSRVLGSGTDTFYYKHAGNYRITMLMMNSGGYDTATQVVQVTAEDPGVNILQGSDMTDGSYWTTLNTGGPQTTFSLDGQGLNISNSANTNGAVYQAVKVNAGVPYTFSAMINGQGAKDSWVEFYIGTTAPVQGSDYTDNKLWSINTWSSCGLSSFNGDVVKIGCSGSGDALGDFVPAKDEMVYIVIKAGSSSGTGGTLGAGGVNVTSVTLNKPSN